MKRSSGGKICVFLNIAGNVGIKQQLDKEHVKTGMFFKMFIGFSKILLVISGK